MSLDDAAVLDLAESAVRIPSPSREEEALARFLVERLAPLGFDTDIDGAGNVVADIGEGELVGALVGHIDTVPGDLPVRRENGVLYGRGSVDAKSSFISFLAAMARVAPRLEGGRLRAIGCVEEEVSSSKGAHYAAAHHEAPRFLVIGEPSGWDSVTLGYKGFLAAEATIERGRAHGAHAEETAAETMARVWSSIHRMAQDHDVGREKLFDQLMARLISFEAGCDESGHDRARALFQWRLPLHLGPDELKNAVEDLLAAEPVHLDFRGGVPAWSGPRTTPLHRHFLAAIKNEGGRGRALRKTGTADLNILAPHWGCPALAYGPGDSALDHAPDERIDELEILRAVRVLEAALRGAAEEMRA